MDIANRIEELKKKINYHNHKYYVLDSPEISDYENLFFSLALMNMICS